MKKVMLLAAMLAMALAAAAPAFGQTAVAGNVQYVDCDQIAAAVQYANAEAEDFSSIAQELNVTQNQILACLGDVNIGAAAPDDDAAAKKFAKKAAKKTVYPAKKTAAAKKTVYPAPKKKAYPAAKKTAYPAPKYPAPKYPAPKKTAYATATATATASPTAAAAATLPPTGGVSAPTALALGASALLVGGGLLARRIVR